VEELWKDGLEGEDLLLGDPHKVEMLTAENEEAAADVCVECDEG
jgi:hypothetical protein